MKCYYHRDVDAIGLCKSCSKGICPPCATDVGGGLACTASCIEEVKNINALIRSNTGATSVNRRAAYFWPVFLMVLGGLFILAPVRRGRHFSGSRCCRAQHLRSLESFLRSINVLGRDRLRGKTHRALNRMGLAYLGSAFPYFVLRR
jgi:hypothetical protein